MPPARRELSPTTLGLCSAPAEHCPKQNISADSIKDAAGCAGRPRPAVRRKRGWRAFSVLVDAVTVSLSVADIITDMLVLAQFRRQGHDWFFWVSFGIFALAQISYAFLFAGLLATGRTPGARARIFVAVLPFAQLVPVFAWLEALHFAPIDRVVVRLGLTPTAAKDLAIESDDGGSLWGFLQSKYRSHAGFIVEALVEAVPQAALQTVFVVAMGHGSALNAASVGFSVFTIASKGYLVSFALDGLTFAFNFLCVVADCFGLFAGCTMIALWGAGDAYVKVFISSLVLGVSFSVIAGFGGLCFATLDDHLKIRTPRIWIHGVRGISNVCFDLYFVPFCAWVLAIAPCVVLFVGTRLSFAPIGILRSVDSHLLKHARFYRCLAGFIQHPSSAVRDQRVSVMNSFLKEARQCADELDDILRAAPDAATPAHLDSLVQRWASAVGRKRSWRICCERPHIHSGTRAVTGAEALPQIEITEAPRDARQEKPCACTTLARRCGSRTLSWAERTRIGIWARRRADAAWRTLRTRSEVFRSDLRLKDVAAELRQHKLRAALRISAVVSLLWAVVWSLPLAACHAVSLLLGALLPAVYLLPTCAASGGIASAVPCALASLYCCAAAAALLMVPLVLRRQQLWGEVTDCEGFPDAFYGDAVLREARHRYVRQAVLRQKLGVNLSELTLSFLHT